MNRGYCFYSTPFFYCVVLFRRWRRAAMMVYDGRLGTLYLPAATLIVPAAVRKPPGIHLSKGVAMFSASQAADINQLATFLSCDQTGAATPRQLADAGKADLLVLLGNAVLTTAERAFRAMSLGVAPKMLIAGGKGHATDLLYQAVARHPVYYGVATAGRSEAEILKDIGKNYFGLPDAMILLENQSVNCGDNALRARQVLTAAGERPRTLILTQDPLMQRRADASFRLVWQDSPDVRFINWPTLVPGVVVQGDRAVWSDGDCANAWPLARFASLLLGEIPRLRDAPGGYGPSGAGFIAHVDIPPHIEAAYARLVPALKREYGDRLI
ncbi:YdcF family protein [Acerihabitans sp. KWT182]|uniref:YdcF family protein n=1 Tax=Acerihabitans sp. KWT182 TaxID=3157919 RepID=A0AAU7Q7G3_9GAMM